MSKIKYLVLVILTAVLTLSSCNKSKQLENPKKNVMTFPVNNISMTISSSKEQVYRFASNPENFPKWLAFVKSVSKQSERVWNAETELGKIKIELTPENEFGIIDHVVTLPDGTKVKNPLRIIANGKGSEVIFTLFRMPDKTEKQFNDDANSVKRDLKKLKELIES